MAYIENFFELFFENKNSLNLQFYQGDISKKEYIEQNYAFLKQLGKPPFKKWIICGKESTIISITI